MGFINGCEDKGLLFEVNGLKFEVRYLMLRTYKNHWKFNSLKRNLKLQTINFKLSHIFAAQKTITIMSNRTLTMIKPDAMKKGYAGAILDMMIKDGFRVVALKQLKLSPEKAGEFYAVHKARPFFGELVEFMSSGPIIAAILEKENAELNQNINEEES